VHTGEGSEQEERKIQMKIVNEPSLQHLPINGNSLGDCVECKEKGEAAGLSRVFFLPWIPH